MAEKKQPKMDYVQCISCHVCATACPISCIDMKLDALKNGYANYNDMMPVVDLAKCIGCGMCEKACPVEAITMVTSLREAS